jgi:hypothetical protein
MEFETDPVGTDRTVTGVIRHRRLPDGILRRLELHGQQAPPQFAVPEVAEDTVERTAR